MKWLSFRAFVLVTLVGGCHHATPVEPPAAVAGGREVEEQTARIYIEAVILEIRTDELRTLRPVVSELASRTDGSVVSSPHVLVESGHPEEYHLPLGADVTHTLTWKFDAHVLDEGRVRLAVRMAQRESDEEAVTTLVLGSGQVAILPTLLPAVDDRVVVVVLQPQIVRSNDDLERILCAKASRAKAARREGTGH